MNSAASSNPILANLLQLAAAGRASPDQLKTLGLLIQSLATVEHANATAQPSRLTTAPDSYPSAPPLLPVKEFDIVLEFKETTSERWVLPREAAVWDKIHAASGLDVDSDILLTTCIPLRNNENPTSPHVEKDTSLTKSFRAVQFRLKRPPLAISDTILRWAGGEEKMVANRSILDALVCLSGNHMISIKTFLETTTSSLSWVQTICRHFTYSITDGMYSWQ